MTINDDYKSIIEASNLTTKYLRSTKKALNLVIIFCTISIIASTFTIVHILFK